MKNKLFLMLMLLGMSFAVSCGDDPTDENGGKNNPPQPKPETEASMTVAVNGQPGASQAELLLTTTAIKQYAFKAYKAGEEPASISALMLFSQGQKGDCVDGENVFTVNKLSANSTYTVFVAGIDTTDEYYKEVLQIEVKTKEMTDEVSQFDVEIDSYKVHVNVNDRVKAGETVYRWGLLDLAQYNYLQTMSDKTDVFFLVQNDYIWYNFIEDDHTFTFDNEWSNMYVTDEDGNLITSEDGALARYYSITPGSPAYFLLGEFAWGDIRDLKYVQYYNDGDPRNEGWYDPLYDLDAMRAYANAGGLAAPVQDQWWEGYHYKQLMESAPATIVEANHTIDATTLAPKGGILTIQPDERCMGMQFIVCTKGMVEEIKHACFKGDDALWEKYLPWFSCSPVAFDLLMGFVYYVPCNINGEVKNIELNLENSFYCNPGDEFVVIMNGHGTETKELNGQVQPTFETQYFKVVEFTIPESKLPLSTIEVTPVETDDPYSVTFNVKCPSKDALFVEYLCDYESAWKKDGLDDPSVLKQLFEAYGAYNRLTGDSLAKINSDEGLMMEIPSRPNAVSYLAAVAYNADKIMGVPATAHVRSAKVPTPDPVDQARFEEVAGDWTASATIVYAPAGSKEYTQMTKTSPVRIGDLTLSETTPQEVYDAYGRKPKEEVDALYAEFYNMVMGLNEEHRSYNRTICQGFDFQVPAEGFESYLRYADPYYLYIADQEIYNGSTTEDIIWEFGPKWYIEFQADGTAYVPFDVTNFAPLSAWIPESIDYYMIAANILTGLYMPTMPKGCKGFPVEISDDKNTITIKGLTMEVTDKETGDLIDVELFPQPVFVQTNAYNSYAWVVSEVVLTRNNTTAASQARLNAPVKGEKAQLTTINRNGGDFVMPAKKEQKFHSRTPLCAAEKRDVIRIDNVKVLTNKEDFYKTADAAIERNFGVKIVR